MMKKKNALIYKKNVRLTLQNINKSKRQNKSSSLASSKQKKLNNINKQHIQAY